MAFIKVKGDTVGKNYFPTQRLLREEDILLVVSFADVVEIRIKMHEQNKKGTNFFLCEETLEEIQSKLKNKTNFILLNENKKFGGGERYLINKKYVMAVKERKDVMSVYVKDGFYCKGKIESEILFCEESLDKILAMLNE